MQPTSPTLSVDTLDAAIGRAVEEGLDTLVSVVNDTRLSWCPDGQGGVRPNYRERVNRQWLPSDWAETGAFVVSRGSCVTPGSRFGVKVGVFEVPEAEGIDVDTFDDLRAAAAHLEGERVAIYVNGNNARGIGHIYRALELADEFYSKPDIYYDVNQTDRAVFGESTPQPRPGGRDRGSLREGKGRGLHRLYQRHPRNFDRLHDRSEVGGPRGENRQLRGRRRGGRADLVFNALYRDADLPQVHAGERYYIASKTFMFYRPSR